MTARIEAAAPHTMNTDARLPIDMDHGQGCYVWDVNGKRYLDGYAVVPDAPCALQDILIAASPPELDMALTAAASAAASAGAAEAAADRAEAAGGGGGVDPSGALLVANRFSEYALNPAAQTAAQANLGLGVSDPLAYYILAKA